MDFFRVSTREGKGGVIEVFPDFIVGRSRDLMVRGKSFYAIWDEEVGLWSTDEYDVQRLVDRELAAQADQIQAPTNVKYMSSFRSNSWTQFRSFLNNISDNHHELDQELTFADQEVRREDYVSRRLPYSLDGSPCDAWHELMGVLYSPEDREKIEWAIGSIVAGKSKYIQKFLVLYGPAGTGKSTVLDIINKMFDGYTTTFDARALGSTTNAFATEVFKNNPLVAIQHDGDLSKINDNTKLNSIVSHEMMTVNEKYKPSYTMAVNAMLFMGTNQPVKITDAKSGIIRRLIDVHPTGHRVPIDRYFDLITQIDFELGGIASHCLEVYDSRGRNYYSGYRPLEMMLQTDVFFNFVEAHYDIFKSQDSATLDQAYDLYKEFVGETGIEKSMPKYRVREELRNYFNEFKERAMQNGDIVRSLYEGFNLDRFRSLSVKPKTREEPKIALDSETSLFDELYSGLPAQYAKENGTPKTYWAEVTTTLGDLDTTQLHYVQVPEHHIIIDFDLKGEDGTKSLDRNLREAAKWPPTYAELSKSGAGVHLHYHYEGDPAELATSYAEDIEVKAYMGNSSLRRLLSKCNSIPVASISSGLPLKEKKVSGPNQMKSEKSLRDLIKRNLRKEIHPGTKPSVDFIHKILQDAYESGMTYDVTDMRSTILAFANNSTNQPMEALKKVQDMKFKSEETSEISAAPKDDPIVFFDVEVYPNLFVICWKYDGADEVVRMINPDPQEVEGLLRMNLVGFNNRRYDNHIIYGRYLGYTNEQLFQMSSKMINDNDRSVMFGEAYGASFADIYDFSSKKQGLKKFMIELGMHHMEMDIPWDEPVPDDKIDEVVEYCVNDVLGTEATFHSRSEDFKARQILSDLSGLRINDTTQRHTARIIFGTDRNPQEKFVYTDLSEEFKGYEFDLGTSSYRGEDPGEGGYVHAEPGAYRDVALLDVASMHPTSIIHLNLFGEYTPRFKELVDARLAIKQGEFDKAREMLDGKLKPYLEDTSQASELSYALKIVINIVYGLTSAKFPNPFRDNRNIDNIVAKRGALFMIDLKHYVRDQGFNPVHIKTDSVKIPGITEDMVEHIMQFGEEYGYDFELEATYDVFCLVNDAVYIAREGDKWTATGAQFQHPYVFKTLFSGEEVTFDDMCETKSVSKGTMWLEFQDENLERMHVGRTGRYVPVVEGAHLFRVHDERDFAVTGTKDYLWVEAEMYDADIHTIDMQYFQGLVDKAVQTIEEFIPFDQLIN